MQQELVKRIQLKIECDKYNVNTSLSSTFGSFSESTCDLGFSFALSGCCSLLGSLIASFVSLSSCSQVEDTTQSETAGRHS